MSATAPSSSLPPAHLAEHTVESVFAEHGLERAWTCWLLLAGLAGALVGQPLLAIRSRELEEQLARNAARQAEHAELIGDLELLTTEPAMVTVKPSGDTAEKNDTAGPLSIPSPLHGGSVVKNPLKTPALQRDYARYWARQNLIHLAGTKALMVLARHELLAAKGMMTRQELEKARHEVERLSLEARLLAEQTLARWQTRLRTERSILAGLVADAQRLREQQP